MAVIVSIDCGGTEITVDSNFITWTPDDSLISNGLARVVQSSNSISPVLNTLRVFTTRKKNCYTYPVTQGDKVLVRPWFYYGNYDRLSNPPTFDLHFDGNFWTTVETSISGLTVHEATYVAKRDVVSVCVAQTKPNQFPFMSALEIRSLDSGVYSDVDESRALFLLSRFSYGASQILRYLDSFDLSGELPEISSMDALEIIDLHNNSLTGTIPDFLGTMPNLRQLNLADNQFSGSIPTTLSRNNKLKLTVTGNPSLCTSGKSCSNSPGTINSDPDSTPVTNKKNSTLPVVLGTTIPAFFLVWVAAGVFIILRRRRKLNMPIVTGGGGANGGSNGLHKIGEEIVQEMMENVVQQTFGSPSPLLDNSDQTSDLYGQTGIQNP
ncbi:hypothetical protein L1987_60152 [Smallanthus sonchifolius]|uniref:Uncharacterized protein n=1 Tax=Smallanthus sonchifolius TaxID=185202 RepID=A0ACB9D7B4_9ASTR|nr:hypothetical protein L1987_60152 [Smallanthus sonchifolius]